MGVESRSDIDNKEGNKMKTYKLNKNELDIMYVLWESKKPLTATEIVESKEGLTTPTVQRLLKKLLANDYVEVAEIVQVGKVLARTYKPKKSMEEYLKEEVNHFFPISKNKAILSKGIVASFFSGNNKQEDEQILSELEAFIERKKRDIENGN